MAVLLFSSNDVAAKMWCSVDWSPRITTHLRQRNMKIFHKGVPAKQLRNFLLQLLSIQYTTPTHTLVGTTIQSKYVVPSTPWRHAGIHTVVGVPLYDIPVASMDVDELPSRFLVGETRPISRHHAGSGVAELRAR